MKYSFTCPLDGCRLKMTVEALGHDEAVEKLVATAKEHLSIVHSELQKTDEQVHDDISSMMVEESEELATH